MDLLGYVTFFFFLKPFGPLFFTVGTCSSVKVNLLSDMHPCNPVTLLELGHAVLLQSKEKKQKTNLNYLLTIEELGVRKL